MPIAPLLSIIRHLGSRLQWLFDRVTDARIDGFTVSSQDSSLGLLIKVIDCQPIITNNRLTNGAGALFFVPFDYNPQVGFGTINGNTITGNGTALVLFIDPFFVWPYPDWDFRWNWWGTTDGSQIEDMFVTLYQGGPPEEDPQVLYDPWLTAPCDSYEETAGFHFNNVYNNEEDNLVILITEIVGIGSTSWGEVKANYK